MAIYSFRKDDLESQLNKNAIWAIVYGDMMSYLMILFLIMLTHNIAENIDNKKPKVERALMEITRVFGGEVDPGIDISQFDGETCIDLAGQVAGDQAEMMDAVLDLVSTLPVLGTLMDTYADYGDTPTGYAITE